MQNHKQLLTVSQMARRLHVPSRWLTAEARAGKLPHLDAGGRLLFHAATVEAALIERARTQEVQG